MIYLRLHLSPAGGSTTQAVSGDTWREAMVKHCSAHAWEDQQELSTQVGWVCIGSAHVIQSRHQYVAQLGASQLTMVNLSVHELYMLDALLRTH